MFIKKYAGQARLMDEANAGDGQGSSTGGSGIDFNDPKVKEVLEARLEQEVSGLKNKQSELLEKLKKAKEDLGKFEGVDVEELRKLKQTLESNEEMKLLAEGKAEEVVTRRVEAMRRDWEDKISARDEKLSELESLLKEKDERLAGLLIDGSVREAYIELGYEPTALDDVLLHARTVFKMDENGSPVPRDGNGSVIFGKDGKTPITQKEWLEGLAVKKPYLKQASKGVGTSPSRFGSGTFDKSTASSKALYAEGLKKLGFS